MGLIFSARTLRVVHDSNHHIISFDESFRGEEERKRRRR
jgi:hypothetical protein